MRVLKWTCDFYPDAEMSIVPVWISFSLLPVHLRGKDFLFALSKIVGMSLRIDEVTADLLRSNEARVYVHMNLEHKLPDRIWIDRVASRSFWQLIVYERLPYFCAKCRHIGHIIDHCRVETLPVETVIIQASKPFVIPAPKLAVALTSKPVVVSANKHVDAPMLIIDKAGKGKEKEVVVEVPKQWVSVAGSASVVAIPPLVVHMGPTIQLTPTILSIVASKPFS
ncbi:DUF4283 domain-containing protein [Abeliophyllum distichum]|uniref:DUF4283 domain-containing protein n=1 Tax=Abeliophyllum distichum TaxID=126358 RepID=A0ABD1TJ45_9LAMI